MLETRQDPFSVTEVCPASSHMRGGGRKRRTGKAGRGKSESRLKKPCSLRRVHQSERRSWLGQQE